MRPINHHQVIVRIKRMMIVAWISLLLQSSRAQIKTKASHHQRCPVYQESLFWTSFQKNKFLKGYVLLKVVVKKCSLSQALLLQYRPLISLRKTNKKCNQRKVERWLARCLTLGMALQLRETLISCKSSTRFYLWMIVEKTRCLMRTKVKTRIVTLK